MRKSFHTSILQLSSTFCKKLSSTFCKKLSSTFCKKLSSTFCRKLSLQQFFSNFSISTFVNVYYINWKSSSTFDIDFIILSFYVTRFFNTIIFFVWKSFSTNFFRRKFFTNKICIFSLQLRQIITHFIFDFRLFKFLFRLSSFLIKISLFDIFCRFFASISTNTLSFAKSFR